MENLIEVCAGPNCAVFADKIKAEIDSLDCSFKIIKTACSKNCGNRFGPPVVRINGDIFQGEIVLQKLREIILSPQSFTASFDRKIHVAGNFQKISGRAGLAIDIGTTNVKIALVDIDAKTVIATASSLNGQVAYGPTVVDRFFYFSKNRELLKDDGLKILQTAVVRTINETIRQLLKEYKISMRDIEKICVAGNTVMSYLFLGRDPDLFGKGDKSHYQEMKMTSLNGAQVIVLPSVSEYIGGDIVSGIFSENLWLADKNRIFIDLGTNGEVVLILKDPRILLAASASAGPAFEGGGFKYGSHAVPGSITGVKIINEKLRYETYNNAKAVNLCGSGIMELVCELFQNHIVDKVGNINPLSELVGANSRKGESGLEILVGEGITVTQNEIKYFIDSKAAIAATISALLKIAECDIERIDEILVAGGFGDLDFGKAVTLGLLPRLPLHRFKYMGNTSLAGAVKLLLGEDQKSISDIISNTTVMDFSSDPDLQKEFFEHYTKERFIY